MTTGAESDVLPGHFWRNGDCFLCGATDEPVLPIVVVYLGGSATQKCKCKSCISTALAIQRTSAETFRRPYVPRLPPAHIPPEEPHPRVCPGRGPTPEARRLDTPTTPLLLSARSWTARAEQKRPTDAE